MTRRSVAKMARQFPENGMKLLLQNPHNVRDLLALTDSPLVSRIDIERMRRVPTTFIRRDYRHIVSDVVLEAPWQRGEGLGRNLLVYVLIEHQSRADRIMSLRVLEYVAQIYAEQARRWEKNHRSFARFQLKPVLPVVFYTGTRRWKLVKSLLDLMPAGEMFASVTPALEPLSVNLPQLDAETLERRAGYFGSVLRLVQRRRARSEEFRSVLADVVGQLETMPAEAIPRRLELVSYSLALVYHERSPTERPMLQETIEGSVRSDRLREELSQMGKTIAEELIEQGERTGERRGERRGERKGERKGKRKAEISARQRTLSRLLEKRFGRLPANVGAVINGTNDVQRLDAWLDQVVTAGSLEEFHFAS